mmetsp:Transcript_27282/g.65333  ORF Transcript_27282/g.65333 Transcript_27282/m.65333 type:complete len:229 (-) Transcript_27282:746-1432(-)|eukprot:CAMPEP_0113473552 /NCGR_PEP_ID=MMETSP0014_2-20120614/18105_1 /TAXON_ID=2857 /ORGANISM="Nitzschia sp." /LENGTH=228 /DNA_ID=CAMNT_0000366327 /DNA_START=88 /DNA_END=774 /DNA_ORIENTATION=+ /assembly_acc=CAM_ASM_000159
MAMSTWFQQLCGGDENVHVEIVQDNAPVHRRAVDVDVDQASVGSSSSPTSPSKEGRHVASRWSSIPELTRMTTTTKYTKKATEPPSRSYRSRSRPSSSESSSAAAAKRDSSLAIQPPKRVPSDEFLCDFDDDDDDDVPCTLATPYGDVLAPCTNTTTTTTNSPIGWPYDGEYSVDSDDIDSSGDGDDDDFYSHGNQRWNESTIDAVETMRSSSSTPPPMPCRRFSVVA